MVRKGLAFFLKAFDDMLLVGEASNGLEAVKMCSELQPNIILMDLMMPDMDGVEATRTIRQSHPDVKVIALTSLEVDRDVIESVLQAGASLFVRKQTSITDLVQIIRELDLRPYSELPH